MAEAFRVYRIGGEEFSSTINRADAMMYSEKNRFYRENGIERRKH